MPGNPSEEPSIDPNDRYFTTAHLDQDLAGRSARGGGAALAAQVAKFAISMGSTVILAHLLTPQDYGVIGMVAILINFVTMFQYLGLSTATIQWARLNHRQVSNLFWVNLCLSGVIALVTIAAAPLIARFYHEPRVVAVSVWYGVSILLEGFMIQHQALLYRQMRFVVIAAIEVTALVTGALSAVLAAWYGAGYWALVWNQLTMTLVSVVGIWVACGWRPGWPSRNTGVRSMLSYGSDITGYNVMTFVARNADNALIGRYWGARELGLYSKAYQILLLPIQQVLYPATSIAVPALSRLRDDPERYRSAYLKITEKIAMLTMPGIAFMIVTSDWLVLLLLGPQWKESARIFMLLGVAAFVQPTARTTLWLFSTQQRSRELLRWGVISGTIALASILGGLPWGAVGVAAAYGLTDFCVTTPLLFWFVCRKGPVRAEDIYRTLTPSVLASLAVLAVLSATRDWLSLNVSLVPRLAIALTATCIVALVIFAALPAGRRAISHFRSLVVLLIRGSSVQPDAWP